MSCSIDLYKNKYDKKTLKEYIYDLKQIDILKTQVLDISFIVKYILNYKYRLHEEDETITIQMVLQYQPHIKLDTLLNALEEYNSDDNSSLEDFESYANRH